MLYDVNKTLELFNRGDDSSVWHSLSNLRAFLGRQKNYVSYDVETKFGYQTWTTYYNDSDHNHILGKWEDVDIGVEPPRFSPKGFGCELSVEDDLGLLLKGGRRIRPPTGVRPTDSAR